MQNRDIFEHSKSGIKTVYYRYVSLTSTGVFFWAITFFVLIPYSFECYWSHEDWEKNPSPGLEHPSNFCRAIAAVVNSEGNYSSIAAITALGITAFVLVPLTGRLVITLTYLWPFSIIIWLSERAYFYIPIIGRRTKMYNKFFTICKKEADLLESAMHWNPSRPTARFFLRWLIKMCYKFPYLGGHIFDGTLENRFFVPNISYYHFFNSAVTCIQAIDLINPEMSEQIETSSSIGVLFRNIGGILTGYFTIFLFLPHLAPIHRGWFITCGVIALILGGRNFFVYRIRAIGKCMSLGVVEYIPPPKSRTDQEGELRLTTLAKQRIRRELAGDFLVPK